MGWKGVERWRGTTERGAVWYAILMQVVDEPFSTAWRVEWWPNGARHEGRSFTGDDREADARAFFTAKRAELGGEWEHLSDVDITRPGRTL